MNTADQESRTPAQKHATFLRSVLALDSSDPTLRRFVPPPDAEPAAEPPPEVATDVTERAKRQTPRPHPRRPG